MSFEIAEHTWQPGARPCAFSFVIDGGSVFADFDIDADSSVRLRRVSFDGYGCWSPAAGRSATTMDDTDAARLQEALAIGVVNTDEVRGLLRRYFDANRDGVWSDALEQYGLLPE